jgi:hypothetical protein
MPRDRTGQRIKERRYKAVLQHKIDKLMEEYLLSRGWQKGRESWMIANTVDSVCRRKEDTIYLTLHKACRLQKKWDSKEKCLKHNTTDNAL